MGENRVYQILYEGEYTYVIAHCYGEAIERWSAEQKALAAEEEYEWGDDEQPEAVMFFDGPVILPPAEPPHDD